MGRARRGGHAGRPTGSGTTFQRDFQDAQKERRLQYARDTAKDAVYKTRQCPSCNGVAICYKADAAITHAGYGARSWWKCPECGHEFTKDIDPEKMEQYYQEDLAKMHSKPQRISNDGI